jgi:hypothetical protein
MRALFLLAGAALALTGCGKNDQSGSTQNGDDNLTAESIVSNDVTAIDAVTGDAANMAADVDTNYGDLDQNISATSSNEAKSPRTAHAKPSTAPEANSTANTTANAE